MTNSRTPWRTPQPIEPSSHSPRNSDVPMIARMTATMTRPTAAATEAGEPPALAPISDASALARSTWAIASVRRPGGLAQLLTQARRLGLLGLGLRRGLRAGRRSGGWRRAAAPSRRAADRRSDRRGRVRRRRARARLGGSRRRRRLVGRFVGVGRLGVQGDDSERGATDLSHPDDSSAPRRPGAPVTLAAMAPDAPPTVAAAAHRRAPEHRHRADRRRHARHERRRARPRA